MEQALWVLIRLWVVDELSQLPIQLLLLPGVFPRSEMVQTGLVQSYCYQGCVASRLRLISVDVTPEEVI